MITKIKREILRTLWKIAPRCVNVRINGTRFKIPLQRDVDYKVMREDRETWMDASINSVYQHTPGAFLDIGAHAGQSLLKVKSLVPSVTYIGFEPNAHCAAYVERLIEINKFEHCRIFPIGLGEHKGVYTLFSHNHADFTATIIKGFRGKDDDLLQQQVIIDHAGKFLDRLHLDAIAMVKIDVEGAEASVLSGLRDVLTRQRPLVMCEVLRVHDPSHPSHAFRVRSRHACEALMHDVGYAIWAASGRHTLVPCGKIRDDWTNYVFVPKEKEAWLQTRTAHAT